MTVTASSIAMVALQAAAKKGAEAVSKNLIDRLFAKKNHSNKLNIKDILGDYVQKTYLKCTRVKTILDQIEPANIFDIYVRLYFGTKSDGVIDDYDAFDYIDNKKHVMIVGSGGTGKSIFMKCLWSAMAVRSTERIPIFIELRNFSDVKVDKLDTFIYSSVFAPYSPETGTEDLFREMLRGGRFVIILDALDEVSAARQQIAQREITRLAEDFPDNLIVVSTREPDDSPSWDKFSLLQMQPLSETSILELVEKSDFDHKVKKKFLAAVKSQLYKTHKSFLEVPLLACLMLIAFEQFADIPTDRHIFYERAFITLFRKHDASKGAFTRQLNSGLTEDKFRTILSYVCLFSYTDERFNFSDVELDRYIEAAAKASKIDCVAGLVRRDLFENVCVIQRDGLEYVFAHRSFQEYFAALCLSGFKDDIMVAASKKLVAKSADMVLPLLFGIGPQRFKAVLAKRVLSEVNLLPASNSYDKLMYLANKGAVLYMNVAASRSKRGEWKFQAVGVVLKCVLSNFYSLYKKCLNEDNILENPLYFININYREYPNFCNYLSEMFQISDQSVGNHFAVIGHTVNGEWKFEKNISAKAKKEAIKFLKSNNIFHKYDDVFSDCRSLLVDVESESDDYESNIINMLGIND